ncbi:hypothetical protein E2C01_063552 [Portunus trituberculatus]|uniref:Uncharacterized protein n=1 Tax=Portunus trituberculatus TaxID=210409 RepID=A0A5B7HAR3_PORTR|nr:hypothetical protein [Portunus trituberculatus]
MQGQCVSRATTAPGGREWRGQEDSKGALRCHLNKKKIIIKYLNHNNEVAAQGGQLKGQNGLSGKAPCSKIPGHSTRQELEKKIEKNTGEKKRKKKERLNKRKVKPSRCCRRKGHKGRKSKVCLNKPPVTGNTPRDHQTRQPVLAATTPSFLL